MALRLGSFFSKVCTSFIFFLGPPLLAPTRTWIGAYRHVLMRNGEETVFVATAISETPDGDAGLAEIRSTSSDYVMDMHTVNGFVRIFCSFIMSFTEFFLHHAR